MLKRTGAAAACVVRAASEHVAHRHRHVRRQASARRRRALQEARRPLQGEGGECVSWCGRGPNRARDRLRRQGRRPSTEYNPYTGEKGHLARLSCRGGRRGRSMGGQRHARRAPRARGALRERREPGHGRLPDPADRPRERRRLRRGRDRDGHARRPLGLDAEDLQARARLEDPGHRLRRARGRARGVGRRVDRRGGRRPRDGAEDEHRLVDADQRRRRGHPEGPAAQGRERRGRVAARAREEPRPQRAVGRRRRAQGVEPDGRGGAEGERDRRGRPHAARAAEAARGLQDRAEGLRARPRGRRDRGRPHVALEADPRRADRPEHHHDPALARHARPARRDVEPGPDLPRDGGRDLPRARAVRALGAARERGRDRC